MIPIEKYRENWKFYIFLPLRSYFKVKLGYPNASIKFIVVFKNEIKIV